MTVADSQTARLLGQGRRLEHFTIGWNVLEAGVSVWAGIVAGSTALIGFGLDSAHIAATETPFPEKNWWRCASGVVLPAKLRTFGVTGQN